MTSPATSEQRTGTGVQPLREVVEELHAGLLPDAEGRHVLEVTLIRSGTSKNGNHYPAEVLQRAVPLFEGAVAFADHSTDVRPERSVRDIVGYYKAPRAIAENGGTRVAAQLHLVPGTDWLWSLLQECQQHPTLCGLSIDALGTVEEGERGARTVTELVKVSSVDVVTRPSAGGSFDRILQSEGTTRQGSEKDMTTPVQTKEGEGTAQTTPPPAAADVTAQLREEAQREIAAIKEQFAKQLEHERKARACFEQLTTSLREAAFPEVVERKLFKRFNGRVFEQVELDEAIAEEKEMLAVVAGDGQVRGLGFDKSVTVGMSEYDQIQAAFDKLFDMSESDAARSVPGFSGIREAFAVATGVDIGASGSVDRPIREAYAAGLRAKVAAGRLTESEVLLREADVTTATFSYLLGTSMNKRLLKDYQAWPSEWQKFCNIVAIKDFKTQDRIRLGSFGSLSTVAEDAAYTTLTTSDTHATYSAAKRGNLVQVTRETIINDDLYAIRQIPQKLAVAAAFTLAEFVYGLVAPGGGNIYDGSVLFAAAHNNSAVAAASLGVAGSGGAITSANLESGVIKMRKQTNMAGKPIGLRPRYLVTVPDNEFTAMTVLKSAGLPGGNNNDINPMMGYMEPIIAPQLNSVTPAGTTVWLMVADPRVIDTIEVGFVGGQANPVLLIQDMPLYGLNFTQDTISYKVRHEYGGAVVDYRGFYLGNN